MIKLIRAREIINSRGEPTVEAEVETYKVNITTMWGVRFQQDRTAVTEYLDPACQDYEDISTLVKRNLFSWI